MKKRNGAPTIAIAGAGFGGIGLAIKLMQAGIHSFTIYERAADIGGVWRDNSYPGAACDVAARLYSYSFEQGYPWSGRFPGQAEILGYMKHCVTKYGVGPHIRYDTEITNAAFDEALGQWILETRGGEQLQADVFVSAVGLFNQPIYPDIPGRDTFEGEQFHSARWNHEFPLEGKTVAVIGTGASAIQFVPTIVPAVGQLHVFQRSSQYVFPKADPTRSPGIGGWFWRQSLSERLDRLRIFFGFEKGARRRGSERLTKKGQDGFLKYLEAMIGDPELRRKLTPDYPLGCKRVLQSNDWYDAMQRRNVELIDISVDTILPDGVRTSDGQVRKVDAIVYGTGFKPTDFLAPMRITGLRRRDLNEAWREGAEAYLGITVSGFPNFFMLYGPNTNAAGSIIFMLESQMRYIVHGIRMLGRKDARFMNLRERVQRRFNEEVQRRIGTTVLVRDDCNSYFRTASGKVTTQWPGFMLEYRYRTRRAKPGDYEFFGSGD